MARSSSAGTGASKSSDMGVAGTDGEDSTLESAAMQTAQLIGTVPLFKLLSDEERADLERVFERRDAAAGENIFSLGEPGDSLYIVGSGSVELFVKDDSGAKISLTTCE